MIILCVWACVRGHGCVCVCVCLGEWVRVHGCTCVYVCVGVYVCVWGPSRKSLIGVGWIKIHSELVVQPNNQNLWTFLFLSINLHFILGTKFFSSEPSRSFLFFPQLLHFNSEAGANFPQDFSEPSTNLRTILLEVASARIFKLFFCSGLCCTAFTKSFAWAPDFRSLLFTN